MTNNAEARAREVLAEHGVVEGFREGDLRDFPVIVDPDAIVRAMLFYGNERAAQEREANAAVDRRIRRLEAALRVARGWVINGTESAQAHRDLVTVDQALDRST